MKLNIPENFYKEEVRDNFTISSEMKHCWAAQLEEAVCAMYGPKDSDEVAITFLQPNWDR